MVEIFLKENNLTVDETANSLAASHMIHTDK